MTIEEERDFLRTWEAKANEGGVLSVPAIHAALVETGAFYARVYDVSLAGSSWPAKGTAGHEASQEETGNSGGVKKKPL